MTQDMFNADWCNNTLSGFILRKAHTVEELENQYQNEKN